MVWLQMMAIDSFSIELVAISVYCINSVFHLIQRYSMNYLLKSKGLYNLNDVNTGGSKNVFKSGSAMLIFDNLINSAMLVDFILNYCLDLKLIRFSMFLRPLKLFIYNKKVR